MLPTHKSHQQFQPIPNEGHQSRRISEDATISVRAAEKTFTLRKLTLASKCGYVKKKIVEAEENEAKEGDESSSSSAAAAVYEMGKVPGGSRGMELAVRFCCDENSVVVDVDNVALLRCVGEFLEMEEEYAEGNLIRKAEEYLRDVVLNSLEDSITVLRHSEGLLPTSDKVGLVGSCIDAITKITCSDRRFYSLPPPRGYSGDGDGGPIRSPSHLLQQQPQPQQQQGKQFARWWAEDLTVLRIDTFKRVVLAMKSKGFKHRALGTILMLYAQKSLKGLDILGCGRKKMDPKQEHEKRVVLETIVSMLPKEENALSVSFLAMLLRAAVFLETTVACRLGLEKRIGLQLGQAVLDDLFLPPPFSFSGDTIFDVDSVGRILVNYLEHSEACRGGTDVGYDAGDDPALSDLERVGGLMESYLAEIATDHNLTVAKFVSVAELIPEKARVIEDGMYRAIDIYLKAHPSVSEAERKKVCSVMDCQRLSREACAHAAQNGRLPIQIVVEVMYHEQRRLSDAKGDGGVSMAGGRRRSPSPYRSVATPERELGRLRRENNDLRSQLGKMKTQMRQVEGSGKNLSATPDHKPPLPPTPGHKPPLPRTPDQKLPLPPTPERAPNATRSIFDSVSKKLGRLNPFHHFDALRSPSSRARIKQPLKSRRHSIS